MMHQICILIDTAANVADVIRSCNVHIRIQVLTHSHTYKLRIPGAIFASLNLLFIQVIIVPRPHFDIR